MEEDEECDYTHILIYDSSAQGDDKDNCSVGEEIKTCARILS
jgi:hypothetical protein